MTSPRSALVLLTLCAAITLPHTALAEQKTAPGSAREQVLLTLQELRRHSIAEDSDADLPPGVSGLLDRSKNDMEALLIAVLAERPELGDRPDELRTALVAELGDAGLGLPRESWNHWGQIVEIGCASPAPGLLAVTAELGVQCGSDTTLHVLERAGQGWRLAIVAKIDGYTNIERAQGHLRFAVSSPDPTGEFWLVTAHVNPWCSSNWQGLFTRVLRPSADPHAPRVVLQRGYTIWAGDWRVPFGLAANQNGFTLRFKGESHLDAVDTVRSRVLAFRIEGDTAVQVAPIADRADDFVDEWARFGWDEAVHWTAPSAREQARRWHTDLFATANSSWSEILLPVRCPGEAARWEVAYDPDTSDESDADFIYAIVGRENGELVLQAISDEGPACGALAHRE